MPPKDLDRERRRRVAEATVRDGVREGHWKLDGGWVRVWLAFHPKQHWCLCDTKGLHEGGADIPDTGRKLTDDVKQRLESWL